MSPRLGAVSLPALERFYRTFVAVQADFATTLTIAGPCTTTDHPVLSWHATCCGVQRHERPCGLYGRHVQARGSTGVVHNIPPEGEPCVFGQGIRIRLGPHGMGRA